MDKFVVAVFPSEAKAYEGTRIMKDLHAEGSLALYGMAVVTKTTDGNLSVDQTVSEGPFGTGVGALTGGLVGLLGGPAGVAAGLAGGALIGGYADLFRLAVSEDFLSKVYAELTPGKSAVVAEVDEDWVTPLDTRAEAIGGTVLRQSRADFDHEQIRYGVETDKAELAELGAEYRQATDEQKAKLKAKIDETRAKLRTAGERAKAKQKQLRQETDAKIKVLQEQRAKAKADAKARLDQRIDAFGKDYDRRADQLIEAAALADDALTP